MARKKKPEEPANLGRWMVSYADFMTLLFAVFVVLYAFAMAKQSEAQSMAQSVAQAFNESLVSASGGVLLIPGSLEEKITRQAEQAQEQAAQNQPNTRSEESGGTIMNFTSAGSPDNDTPNTAGGAAGEDLGRSGQSASDVSKASGDLIVSDSKSRSPGSPHTEKPTGGSDAGAGGFTPGGQSDEKANGGHAREESSKPGEGKLGQPFDSIRKSVSESLADTGAAKDIQIEEDQHWLTLNINSGMLFAEGSASILSVSRPLIAKIAVALSPVNNYVRIRGYTDNTFEPNGIYKNSWQLSAARSINVLNELAADGIAPERMAVEAYGEYAPFVSNSTPAGRARNRRVVVAISRYAVENPGTLDVVDDDGTAKAPASSSGTAGSGSVGVSRGDDNSVNLSFGGR